MTDRRPEQDDNRDDERPIREFSGFGGYASTERDQTRSRENVRNNPVDEAGELPDADADVEAGESRRAERYED
jgi:hypothetical protein